MALVLFWLEYNCFSWHKAASIGVIGGFCTAFDSW